MFDKFKPLKRIISAVSAVVMMAGNAVPLMPMNAYAENTTAVTSAAENNEAADQHDFEYSDENISVNVTTEKGSVFTDGKNETEGSVSLYAQQTDAPQGNSIEAEDNEIVEYYNIGFKDEKGNEVFNESITSDIDFNVNSDDIESVSDIEIYSIDEQTNSAVALNITDDKVRGDTETVSVRDYKLGTYAVKYTVDFHYDELEYNLRGEGDILLSELFAAFGIEKDIRRSSVEFTNDDLLRLEQIREEDVITDWRLVSLKPFDTHEKLTVTLESGEVIELGVTDDQTDAQRKISVLDLSISEGADYANLFEKAAETYKNADGSYTLPETFTYKLPDGSEWTPDAYDKAVNNHDGTYTVAAADVPPLMAWVWTPDSSDEDHRIVYSLHLVTEGYNVINPGEMEIRMPKSILPDGADTLELSMVTKEEYLERQDTAKDTKNIRFVYEFDGNDIVFTNVKAIPSGFDGALYVAYHTTKKTYDYQDMAISANCYAKASVYELYDPNTGLQTKFLNGADGSRNTSRVDEDGNRIYDVTDADGNATSETVSPEARKEADAVPVYINTGVEIKNLTKTLTQSNVYQDWNASWGEEPAGDELGEGKNGYIYFMWELKSEVYTQPNNPTKITQKYDFTLTDDTIDTIVTYFNEEGADDENHGSKTVHAENIMFKMAGKNWQNWESASDAERTVTDLTEKNGTVRRDYVLTRIPRDELKTITDDNGKKIGTAFQITNTANVQVTPADSVDKITAKADSEQFTYAPPVYVPPVAHFDMNKVGVYTSNEKTVITENQISSFELENFKNEEIKQDVTNLRYHVSVNAEDLADTFMGTYYGDERDVDNFQKIPVEYVLTDNTIKFCDLETKEEIPLSREDYCMTDLDVSVQIKAGRFDNKLLTFLSEDISNQTDAIVTLRLYDNGADTPVDVAEYDEASDTWTVLAPDYVSKGSSSFRGFSKFIFADDKNITGYELYSNNPYYGTYYKAYPTVTLRSTDRVRGLIGAEDKKIQLNNYAQLKVKGRDHNNDPVEYEAERMGKVYVSEAEREAHLTKKFIATDYNDIMNGEYLANWEIELYETMQTGENEYLPVVQGGGIFYDLLPIMSTARLDEIEVYPMYEGATDYESTPLNEGGDYTVDYSYQTDKSGFKRVLLKVDISEPAYKYKLKIRTIHTHADILDYGRNIRNSVCYKTKNPDLGKGQPNDGKGITDGSVFVNMGEMIGDTDKKKFKYSQATHYIPALISTVSEIQKTVSSESTPTAGLSAIVTPNEEYEYHYRNMNTGSTYSTHLVIMDSLENFRTADGKTMNGSQYFNKQRDWYGTPLHFNTQLLDRKGIDYDIYVTDKDVNLGKYNTDTTAVYHPEDPAANDPDREVEGNSYKQIAHESTMQEVDGSQKLVSTFVQDVLSNNDGWVKITQHADYSTNTFTFTTEDGQEYDLSRIKGFMIDFKDHVFSPNESVLFSLTMRAPSEVGEKADPSDPDKEKKTYNNVYRYHDTSEDKDFDEEQYIKRTFTHQDKTDVIYRVAGDVRLRKVDADDPTKVIHNAVFVLEGTSAYGTSVKKKLSTDANGNITFKNIEEGTYILRETDATANYQITEPRTVVVDSHGVASITNADDLYAFDITVEKRQSSAADAAPESEAKFTLTRNDSGEGGTAVQTGTSHITDAAGLLQNESIEARTNSAGVAQFINVPAGEYTMTYENTASNQNYSYNIKVLGDPKNAVVGKGEVQGVDSFLIDTDSAAKIMLVRKEYGIEDDPRYHADLFFNKMICDPADGSDKYANAKILSGAEFTLTTIGNGSSDHADTNQYFETINMKAVSSDTGVSFENLGIGKYILYESKAPEGAVPDDTIYYVWVQGSKTETPTARIFTKPNYTVDTSSELPKVNYTYQIYNEKTAQVTLHKRDNVNKTEMLAGAQFDLYPYGTVDAQGAASTFAMTKADLTAKYAVKGYTASIAPDKESYDAGDAVTISYTPDEGKPAIDDRSVVVSPVYEEGLNDSYWRKTADWGYGTHVSTQLKTQFAVSDSEGEVSFGELQPGVAYKLTETKAPKNHKDTALPEWEIRVSPDGTVKVYQNNTEISDKVEDEYVITNERTYNSEFQVVKTWVGDPPKDDQGNPSTFPVIKMSTQEKEDVPLVATLNKSLFKTKFPSSATSFTRLDIATNPGDPIYTSMEDAWDAIVKKEGTDAAFDMATQFVRVDETSGTITYNYPESIGSDVITPRTDNFANEEGVVYMACINNHTYFWSDAKKIYLPEDSNELVKGISSLSGTVDFTYFYGDRVKKMQSLFKDCPLLTSVKIPNINNCYNCENMERMFQNDRSLTTVVLPVDWDCRNNTSFRHMFYGDNMMSHSLDFSGLRTSSKFKMMEGMFHGYGNSQSNTFTITFGDEFDTSKVTGFDEGGGQTFRNCNKMTSITFGKKCTFASVTNFSSMFGLGCAGLVTINGLCYFDTSNATTFQNMFSGCSSLTSLDLSSFTTDKNPNIRDTFGGCKSLVTIYANPYEWPMENYWEHQTNQYYYGGTFKDCNVLTGGNGSKSLGSNYDNAIIDGVESTIKAYDGSTFTKSKGYFTDWSKSPHYAYVYNKYREAHPELNLPALSANSSNSISPNRTLNKASAVRLLGKGTSNALLAAGESSQENQGFTAPEVIFLTGKKALSAAEAQSKLSALGLTYEDDAYYVSETVTAAGVVVNDDLVAKWVINSDQEWVCTMMVYDKDALCYVWEDEKIPYTVNGSTKYYECDHDSTSKLEVQEKTGYAEITNKREGETDPEYGSLAISKSIFLGNEELPENMRRDDEFTFIVTITPKEDVTAPNKAIYGGVTFVKDTAENKLVGKVTITRTIQDESIDGTEYGTVLTRIPEGWTYSITEDPDAEIAQGRSCSQDYTDKGAVTAQGTITGNDPASGTIVKDTQEMDPESNKVTAVCENHVTWRNDLRSTDLVITKQLARLEKGENDTEIPKALTESDREYQYGFKAALSGLYPDKTYSYTCYDANDAQTQTAMFTADEGGMAAMQLKLRHSEKIKFNDLPIGAVYTIEEQLPEQSNTSYRTQWSRFESDAAITEETAVTMEDEGTAISDRLDKHELVRFDNTKITEKTIDVNVEKFWFADDSEKKAEADVAVVTLQRNNGMYVETPDDDSARTLDSSNGWKDTFADCPTIVDGRKVTYTIGEITVGGYKPGELSTYVGGLSYGSVNTLYENDAPRAYFAYKTGFTFKIGTTSYTNKAVEVCKYNDTVYMYYDGELYTLENDEATKCSDNTFKYVKGTQNRFMKKTNPDSPTDYAQVYESYVNNVPDKKYEDSQGNKYSLGQVIISEGNKDSILYIQHTDGIFYKASTTLDGGTLKLGDPVFRWNTSDDVISDSEGNLNYIVTNVKIKTYSVAISKTVEGNFGNKAKDFEFDIIAGSLNDTYPVARTYNGVTKYEMIEFTSGIASIELSHGQTVVISNLPEGTNVTVRERDYKNYDVSSVDGNEGHGNSNKGGEISVVLNKDQSIAFTNTLVGTVPTGVEMQLLIVVMIGLAAAGLIIYIKYKKIADEQRAAQSLNN